MEIEMGCSSKSFTGAICLLFLMFLVSQTQADVFNVRNFGAKANSISDDSQAVMSAWKKACTAPEPSALLIPKGTYLVSPINLDGPCKAPIKIQVAGSLKAPADVDRHNWKNGWVSFQNVDRLTLAGGRFDGQGSLAWKKNDCAKTGKCSSLPINMGFNSITNSIIQDVTSVDSKLFHMNIVGCNNLTLQHVTIKAPANSLNTDGIHIGRSKGIRVIDADIGTGDDCISLGDGAQKVHIERVTCGPGHGIAIGSLGKYHDEQPVFGVSVLNCTLTNTMNGIRVKTWPASPAGIARDLHFENVKMNNVSNPILIDQNYCPYGQCKAQAPSRVQISNVSFKNIRGTSATKLAVRLVCSRGQPCQNVKFTNIHLTYTGDRQVSVLSECANVKPALFGRVFPPPCKISSH